MEVTSISTEHVSTKYTIAIEHEGEEYEWVLTIDEEEHNFSFFHNNEGEWEEAPFPEWLEDEDFFDLLDAADNDPAFSED